MIQKTLGITLVASLLMVSLSSSALLINHRVKCYGLKECKAFPKNCSKDKNGLYIWMKKRDCKTALENN